MRRVHLVEAGAVHSAAEHPGSVGGRWESMVEREGGSDARQHRGSREVTEGSQRQGKQTTPGSWWRDPAGATSYLSVRRTAHPGPSSMDRGWAWMDPAALLFKLG